MALSIVVKLLKQYDIAASWTMAAMRLETHPELGHEPVSHGYRWVHQFRMDEAGFAYHMDAFSGDVPFWGRDTVPGKPLAIVPHQVDSNDMKMWTDQAFGPEQWLTHALRNFDQVLREGREGNPKMMSLGLHLRIIGRPGRIWALEQFLAHVRQHDDVWIATRHQIAQALAAVDPA